MDKGHLHQPLFPKSSPNYVSDKTNRVPFKFNLLGLKDQKTGLQSTPNDRITQSNALRENLPQDDTKFPEGVRSMQESKSTDIQRKHPASQQMFSPALNDSSKLRHLNHSKSHNQTHILDSGRSHTSLGEISLLPHVFNASTVEPPRIIRTRLGSAKSLHERIDDGKFTNCSTVINLTNSNVELLTDHSLFERIEEATGMNKSNLIEPVPGSSTLGSGYYNERLPSVYSRSASVISSLFAKVDEDIPAIMMRGATDLRNAKFEVEEQVSLAETHTFYSLSWFVHSVVKLISSKNSSTQ